MKKTKKSRFWAKKTYSDELHDHVEPVRRVKVFDELHDVAVPQTTQYRHLIHNLLLLASAARFVDDLQSEF